MRLARGETVEAIEEFQKVLKLEPRSARARYHLALAYRQAGNPAEARSNAREATRMDPDFVEATLLEAELEAQTGARQPAIRILDRLLAKRPDELRAWVLLGSMYLAGREPAEAADAYRKVVALAPKEPRAPYLLGLALLAQGKSAEARQAFEASLALAPAYVEPLAQLVGMALAAKAPDTAADRVQQQIGRAPHSGALHALLGRIYVTRGQLDRAETAFLRATQLEPRLFDAYRALAEIYAREGKDAAALAKAAETFRANPKDVPALMLVAVIHERSGDRPKALEAYERVLAVDPNFVPAANNAAYLYAERGGDQDRALDLARRAREAAPEEPRLADTLGWVLYKRGAYRQALALLSESGAKLPDSADVQYHLGLTLHKLRRPGEARRALTRALALDPKFLGAAEAARVLAELDASRSGTARVLAAP